MIIKIIEKIRYYYGRLFIKSIISELGEYNKSDISYPITVKNPKNLKIGINCKIGPNCTFGAYDIITLEKNVRISSHCLIETGSLNLNKKNYGDHTKKPILIKENVWIGTKSLILQGVTIGENSFISAGSIVKKNIPPNSIYSNGAIKPRNYEE